MVLRSCRDHSTYLWEDDAGTVHHIEQGEGGEQGDMLMPLVFSLGQHAALQAVKDQLLEGERLFAFLDDIYVVTTPERVCHVYTLLHVELQRHSSIQINGGKTRVWNAAGERPPACDLLEWLSPDERVWRGSNLPEREQGIRVLGTPLGHPAFVQAQLEETTRRHQTLLERIPAVQDVQSAWALLLQRVVAMFGKDSWPEFRAGHHNPRGGVSPIVPRRAGFAERCSDKSFSILGKLVRFTAHDQSLAPRGGRLYFASHAPGWASVVDGSFQSGRRTQRCFPV